jgi:methionyl aminopeptidase
VIELRTPAEIEQMKPAGRFVADVLTRLAKVADVGVNLLELDALAHEMIRERGAESCYIDYHPSFGAMPFGKVLCTSVNDAVLHGLPFDYALRDGDLLSVDFAASVDGWVADSALSVVVGRPAQQDLDLIDTASRGAGRGHLGRAHRGPDRGHLGRDRRRRPCRRPLGEHRLRRARRGSHDAR